MILVDTHVVLWLALEPARISRKAAGVIEETRHSGQGLAISDMTLLEIAVIESKSRIHLSASLETFLTEVESRFVVLAYGPWGFRSLIPKIRRIGSSERPHWSREFL